MIKSVEWYQQSTPSSLLSCRWWRSDNVHIAFRVFFCCMLTQLFTSEALRYKRNLWHLLAVIFPLMQNAQLLHPEANMSPQHLSHTHTHTHLNWLLVILIIKVIKRNFALLAKHWTGASFPRKCAWYESYVCTRHTPPPACSGTKSTHQSVSPRGHVFSWIHLSRFGFLIQNQNLRVRDIISMRRLCTSVAGRRCSICRRFDPDVRINHALGTNIR